MTFYIGYKPSGDPAQYRSLSGATEGGGFAGNQRASISTPSGAVGYAYQMAARIGRITTDIPLLRLAAWGVVGSNPSALLGRTAEFSAGTYMLDRNDGTLYTRDLEAAFLVSSGQQIALGAAGKQGPYGFGMSGPIYGEAGGVPVNNQLYRRSIGNSNVPQDPFDPSSADANVGQMAVYLVVQEARAPNTPNPFTMIPVPASTITDLTPTFKADFVDADQSLPGGVPSPEKLSQVQIQVATGIDVDGNLTGVIWNYTYTPTSAEQLANQSSQTYLGSPLSTATTYYWRIRFWDAAGKASQWSPVCSFVTGVGYADTSGTGGTGLPTGKQQTKTPGPFTMKWVNPSSSNAKWFKLRIRERDATTGNPSRVLREMTSYVLIPGGEVAVNGTISIPWANTSFLDLPAGSRGANNELDWQAMIKDAAGVETQWSNSRTFAVNTPPSIPAQVSPLDGAVSSARPELVVTCTDPDDTIGTGLVVKARILASDGVTVIQTRDMAYDAPTATWRYQTVSGDMASTGVYNWDSWSYDGTFYGSGNTSLGPASLSSMRSVTYTGGPIVTINEPDPGDVVNTNTPLIDWSFTDPQRHQVTIFQTYADFSTLLPGDDPSTVRLIYQSAERVSAATSFRIPAGYLEDDEQYRLQVTAWNGSNERGDSSTVLFSVDIDVATQNTGFQVSPHTAPDDLEPTANFFWWDPTTYTSGQFQKYILMRRAVDEGLFDSDDPDAGKNRRIAEITDPAETTYIDYTAAADTSYVYSLKQEVQIDMGGGDLVTQVSSPVYAEARLSFQQTVISSVRNPASRRLVLPYREDRGITYPDSEPAIVPIWGSAKPRAVEDDTFYREITTEYVIIGDEIDRLSTIRAMELLKQSSGPMLYRDGRRHRWFGTIKSLDWNDPPAGAPWVIRLTFTQTDATEKAL